MQRLEPNAYLPGMHVEIIYDNAETKPVIQKDLELHWLFHQSRESRLFQLTFWHALLQTCLYSLAFDSE